MITMNSLESDVEIHPDGSMHILSPLPAWLKPGHAHVVLTVDKQKVKSPVSAPQPGSLKGFRMAADFDDPLEDFKDYMG